MTEMQSPDCKVDIKFVCGNCSAKNKVQIGISDLIYDNLEKSQHQIGFYCIKCGSKNTTDLGEI